MLKNTFKSSEQARIKGQQSEQRVQEYLEKKGFYLIAGRWKTPFAELDLVFKKQNTVYIFEVKSLGSLDFGLVRVSGRQRQRLLNARNWLESQMDSEVSLAFAYVLPDNEILLFNFQGEKIE